uniref:ATP synthase complex subunit 8 n=1 Tax=Epigonichthys cultellus TaxID=1355229 RepID=A0A0E3D814_9BRAN|nr:ATP synthase F0 subunit 8 [Epigonichthys cultellus]AGQ42758.1 ATP synthase F0 subunit 8 [Epigonichthys cultellus]BAV13772.1 ATP synthase subunit 8 [Epigonichthys cultellus]
MPQLNPIPWVFLFMLVWGILLTFGLHKYINRVAVVMREDVEVEFLTTKEFSWPW